MHVALVGPNADNVYNMLGDYTAPQPEGNVATVLDGIRSKLPIGQVTYVKGCSIRDTTQNNIAEAVEAARKDMNVMVVQAEDEIAGVCTAIGASFAGDLAATSTSGPGLSLKSEAIGLAVMAELPRPK